MINSFRFPFFMLFPLIFIGFDANATAFPLGEIVSGESEEQPWWQTHPCFVMLAKEFQRNKEQGVSYKFSHRGGNSLESIAQDDGARPLDNEGLKWHKSCYGEPHIWSTEPCRGIKKLHNPFYLSYADLYAFYRIKDQLVEGTPFSGLWEDLFPEE